MKKSGVLTQSQNCALQAVYLMLSGELESPIVFKSYDDEKCITACEDLWKTIRILGRDDCISVTKYYFEKILTPHENEGLKFRNVRFELSFCKSKPLLVELTLQGYCPEDENADAAESFWCLWKVQFLPSSEHDEYFNGFLYTFPKEYEVMRKL